MQGNLITCPGCGLILPKKNYLPDNNYKTSKECFELFAQRTGYPFGSKQNSEPSQGRDVSHQARVLFEGATSSH